MLTTTNAPLTVLIREHDRWQRALQRAVSEQLTITQRHDTGEETAGFTLSAWLVESASERGHRYQVIVAEQAGITSVACECTAGAFGNPCLHAALAIDTARAWPQGSPLRHTKRRCPYCGSADELTCTLRETNPNGWQGYWRCWACRAHLGYEDELDMTTLRRKEARA